MSPGIFPGLGQILGRQALANNYSQGRFPSSVGSSTRFAACQPWGDPEDGLSAAIPINAHEKALLLRALHQVQFNRTAAAALLGLNLRQIRYRMERLGIISNDKTDDNQPT